MSVLGFAQKNPLDFGSDRRREHRKPLPSPLRGPLYDCQLSLIRPQALKIAAITHLGFVVRQKLSVDVATEPRRQPAISRGQRHFSRRQCR